MADYLVDTCVLLWATSEPDQLSAPARACIEDESNRVFISVATLWELSIKVNVGKLKLPKTYFDELGRLGYEKLAIDESHLAVYRKLPLHHRDPFDRLLVAQSIAEEIPLITSDSEIGRYKVRTVW